MTEALIYAAGFGARMGNLTRDTPKPMLNLVGRPMIDQVREYLLKGGVKHCHINTHYLSEQIVTHYENQPDVSIHDEPCGPFETGGTLKALSEILPETVITANSDALFLDDSPLEALWDHWNENIDALLMCVPVENALCYGGVGDFFYRDGVVTRRGEAASAPLVFTGLQIIRPAAAHDISEAHFSTNLIWNNLIENGRIAAAVYQGRWLDVGTKQALEQAEELLASR